MQESYIKKIAIVGASGRFGSWFKRFFSTCYECDLICYDKADEAIFGSSIRKQMEMKGGNEGVEYKETETHKIVFDVKANRLHLAENDEEKVVENYVQRRGVPLNDNDDTAENMQPEEQTKKQKSNNEIEKRSIGYYKHILDNADVILFAVPLGATPAVVRDFCAVAGAEELEEKTKKQLWMDVATLKEEPVEEMLKSNASVVGLHPMTGPPIENTLKGKILVFCPRRFNSDEWLHWFNDFLKRTEAKCTRSSAQMHDRKSCFLQTLIHASHLIMASVLAESEEDIRDTLEFKTPPYNFALSVMARVLYRAQSNPGMYSEIQLLNQDNTDKMFDMLKQKTDEFISIVKSSDREKLIEMFFTKSGNHFGGILGERDRFFDRIAAFMADMSEGNAILIEADKDEAGLLHDILTVFTEEDLNMTSLHSFKVKENQCQFWIGLEKRVTSTEVDRAVHKIIEKFETRGRVIRVLPSPGYD